MILGEVRNIYSSVYWMSWTCGGCINLTAMPLIFKYGHYHHCVLNNLQGSVRSPSFFCKWSGCGIAVVKTSLLAVSKRSEKN